MKDELHPGGHRSLQPLTEQVQDSGETAALLRERLKSALAGNHSKRMTQLGLTG